MRPSSFCQSETDFAVRKPVEERFMASFKRDAALRSVSLSMMWSRLRFFTHLRRTFTMPRHCSFIHGTTPFLFIFFQVSNHMILNIEFTKTLLFFPANSKVKTLFSFFTFNFFPIKDQSRPIIHHTHPTSFPFF